MFQQTIQCPIEERNDKMQLMCLSKKPPFLNDKIRKIQGLQIPDTWTSHSHHLWVFRVDEGNTLLRNFGVTFNNTALESRRQFLLQILQAICL